MSSSGGSQGSSGQEYIVRVPRANKKKYHVMQFTSVSNLDITKLGQARMERENNMKEFKADEDMPKYGAGSEYGRDQREEARRKKHGISLRKYNPDDQPWILKIGGKGGKKYKGIRGGGITENASYYVFTQAADGAFEASPIEEWYNFSPIQRYKALSAEEAEEEFGRRDKVLNYFSIMLKKRLKKEEEGEALDGEEKAQEKKKKKKGKQSSEFRLTDMDEWLTDSENDSEDEKEEGANPDKKKTTKKETKDPKKKKKKKDSDDEAMEESDEGDFDDREVDYITDSSSSSGEEADEKVNREMKGVEDEDALRKLDNSEDEEEEEKKETAENEENGEKEPAAEQKAKQQKEKKAGSSGESSGETSDSDFDDNNFQSAMFMQKTNRKKTGSDNSGSNSRANTPTKMLGDGTPGQQKSFKRKSDAIDGIQNASKRSKNEATSSSSLSSNNASSSTEGITDEAVRRYLMRKPMTTTELLQKFRSAGKKAGVTGNELVTTIAKILKRLNPEKQTIKGKLYLSIKSSG